MILRERRQAFSLVELLVALFIIATLCSLLLPALSRARQDAQSIRCQANLRSVGEALKAYEVQNQGWFYPVTAGPKRGNPHGRGMTHPPHERWPMYVFDMLGAPSPPPYDPSKYHRQYDPLHFAVLPYTPAILRCPTDEDPVEAHTYFLNGIAAQRHAKAGNSDWGNLTFAEVILAGEKYTLQRDYFIEDWKAFSKVVDPYRHGARRFSNYLFFDGHVASAMPSEARRGLNPWLEVASPTTTPSR